MAEQDRQCCGGAPTDDVGNGFPEVKIKVTKPIPVYTEHHPARPLRKTTNIAERAAELLETAAKTIRERGASYNTDEIGFEDYRLGGMASCWQDILECFVRLYASGQEDKAIDWVAYSALQAAFVEAGMPTSQFAPIYKKVIKGLR